MSEIFQQKHKWRAAGLCYACGAEVALGHKLCERHLEYHREYARNARAERRAQGLCLFCRERACHGALCDRHWTEAKARERRKYKKKMQRRKWAKTWAKKHHRKVLNMGRRYRRRLVKSGLCVVCKIEPPQSGKMWCVRCKDARLAEAKEAYHERRAAGLCGCGRAPRKGKATCTRCAARARKIKREQRARRAAQGLCSGCREPVLPGFTKCEHHKKMEGEYHYQAKLRAAGVKAA